MALPPASNVPVRRAGVIGRLFAFLLRLFKRKSPLAFDHETGSWVEPDIYLPASPNEPLPPDIENQDCNTSHVVYAVAANVVAQCNLAARQLVVADATDRAQDYFDKHFECKHKDCIKKVAEVIWTGSHCGNTPLVATGAVLMRMRCEVEF